MEFHQTLRNFKCHKETTVTFGVGEFGQIAGDSGTGKSTLLLGTPWILFGIERGVGHFDEKNKKDSRTYGSISCDDWVIERYNKPEHLTVTVDDDVHEGDEAKDWIKRRFGQPQMWNFACLQRLRVPNIILSGTQEQRDKIMHEISFSSEDIGDYKGKSAEHAKLKQEEVKYLVEKLSTIEGVMDEEPSDEGPAPKTVKDVKSEMKDTEAEILKVNTVAKQRDQLTTKIGNAEGIISANSVTAKLGMITDEERKAFEKSDLVLEWKTVLSDLKSYNKRMQEMLLMDTEVHVLRDELKMLEEKDLPHVEGRLMTEKEFERAKTEFCDVEALSQKLALPSGKELTCSVWNKALEDMRTWRSNITSIQQWRTTEEGAKEEEKAIDDEFAVCGVPKDVHENIGDNVKEALTETTSIHEMLNKTEVRIDSEDLDGAIEERLVRIKKGIWRSERAQEWKDAEAVFEEINQKKLEQVPVEKITQIQESIFQMKLDILTCPSCQTSLILSGRDLKHHSRKVNSESLEELQAKLKTLLEQTEAWEDAQRLIKSVMDKKLSPKFAEFHILTPESLKATQIEIRDLSFIQERDHLPLTSRSRDWLLSHGARFIACVAREKRARDKTLHRQQTRERLIQLFGSIEGSDTEIFNRWWTKDNLRGIVPDEENINTKNPPDFVAPVPYSLETLKSMRRMEEVCSIIKENEAVVKKIKESSAPTILFPEYPYLPHLDSVFGDGIRDIAALNTAFEEIRRLIVHLDERQQLFQLWKVNEDQVRRADEARATLLELRPKLDEVMVAVKKGDTLRVRHSYLRLFLPWLQRKTEVVKITDEIEVKRAELLTAKKLVERVRRMESIRIESAMDVYSDDVNDIISEMFTEPTSVDFTGFRLDKNKKQTSPSMNFKINIDGHTHDKADGLSDGEYTRFALALSMAAAKNHNFPFFAIDESLSTLQPELRNTIINLQRKHLTEKAVVNVIHDDGMSNFDSVTILHKQ